MTCGLTVAGTGPVACWRTITSVATALIAEDQPFTITPTWTADVVRTFMLKGERFRQLDRYGGLPTDSIILQRITVGLLAVLGRLHATAKLAPHHPRPPC